MLDSNMEEVEMKMRFAIKQAVENGKNRFVIYPYGMQGHRFKEILNQEFGIEEIAILDEKVVFNSEKIIRLEMLSLEIYKQCDIFITSDNEEIWYELRKNLLHYVPSERIINIFPIIEIEMLENIIVGNKVKVLFDSVLYPIENDLISVGGNTGNLVFSGAIKENIKFDMETQLSEYWREMGTNNTFSIMAASNFINPSAIWIENLISFLEKSNIHFIFCGLGAQGGEEDHPHDIVDKLSKKQIYFFRLAAEKAKSIGVRGEFSAEYLGKMGIKNIEVIGCPSFYFHNDHRKTKNPTIDKILFTADRNKTEIFRLTQNRNAQLIRQVYSDGKDEDPIFFDFYKWNQYIKENDFTFAFGTRFHGNMMALRNGVPTLWIVHDQRTLELVRYLRLPYIEYKKSYGIKHLEELIVYCDYSEMYREYPKLLKRYSDFISLNLDERLIR